MIRNLLVIIVALLCLDQAQSQAKRYIFMEHFTNSRCGICAGSNPGYYKLLDSYKGNYHHLSIHPSIPYSSCLLYQHNKNANTTRTNYYSIFGTPTVVINGTSQMSAGSVKASTLDALLNKTSPIQIIVKETGMGSKTANIEIKTLGDKPSGNYRLFVVIAERVLNYASPNGEKVHYDVLRDIMSPYEGEEINLADIGSSVSKSYTININPTWVESQMYAIAWVQNTDTKEVMNSGTKFDIVSSNDEVPALDFRIYPNPVDQTMIINWPVAPGTDAQLSISNLFGQEIFRTKLSEEKTLFELPVQKFVKGIYFTKIESKGQKTIRKWVKQ